MTSVPTFWFSSWHCWRTSSSCLWWSFHSLLVGRHCIVRGHSSFSRTVVNGWLGWYPAFQPRVSYSLSGTGPHFLNFVRPGPTSANGPCSYKGWGQVPGCHHQKALSQMSQGHCVHHKATGVWGATPESHDNALPKVKPAPPVLVCCSSWGLSFFFKTKFCLKKQTNKYLFMCLPIHLSCACGS